MATRRSFLTGLLAGGVFGQGFNLTIMRDVMAKPTGEPIRIGHQCDLTGGISSWGYWHDKAAKAAVEYLNQTTGIAGRPVELITEDTETNPPTGARKFRSLVQRSNADFVIGSVHSGVNLATVPIARELQTDPAATPVTRTGSGSPHGTAR